MFTLFLIGVVIAMLLMRFAASQHIPTAGSPAARLRGLHAVLLRKFRGRLEACLGKGQLLATALLGSPPTGRGLEAACGEFLRVSARPVAALVGAMLIVALAPHLMGATSHSTLVSPIAVAGVTANADLRELLNDLHTAFHAFREANDERVTKIEKGQTPDPLLVAKVDKANADLTRLNGTLEETRQQLREVENATARDSILASKTDAKELDVQNSRRFFSLVRNKPVESITNEDLTEYRNYRKALATYFRRGQAAFNDREISAALTTGAAPSGGFWLTPDSSGKIVEFLEDLSSLRSMASVSPIGTDTFEGFYDLDEAQSGGWVGETSTRSETDTPRTDGKYTFPIFEQYANPKASQKMLDDSENDVETWLAKKVASKMAKFENAAFPGGNGITRPKGFLMYPAGTPARTSVDAYRVIRQINSGAAATFAATNPGDKFIDMIQALPSAVRKDAEWAMTSLTLAEVRKFKDGQGNYLFIPDFSASSTLGTLLGYKINELSDMPELGANNLSVAFANWKEAYEIKDHVVGTRVLRDPYTGKPYVSFYTTKRVGGDVTNFQAIVLMKCHT